VPEMVRLRRLKFSEIDLQDIYPIEELMLLVKRNFPYLETINDQPYLLAVKAGWPDFWRC
jgi:hypothetical protein